jgi:hypothetical protein
MQPAGPLPHVLKCIPWMTTTPLYLENEYGSGFAQSFLLSNTAAIPTLLVLAPNKFRILLSIAQVVGGMRTLSKFEFGFSHGRSRTAD